MPILLLALLAAVVVASSSSSSPAPPPRPMGLTPGARYDVVARSPLGTQNPPQLAALSGWTNVQGKGVVQDAHGLVFEFNGTWSGQGMQLPDFQVTAVSAL